MENKNKITQTKFRKYKATREDFNAIETGIRTLWRPELNFIFKRKNLLKDVVVVSYDSSFIYFWTKVFIPNLKNITCGLSDYYLYKIPHKVKISNQWQAIWFTGPPAAPLNKLLPRKFRISQFKAPILSGGLLTPFIKLQKDKNIKDNPYINRASYLATIIHELGHVYWNQHKLWWYSNKKENLFNLQLAKQLYEKKKIIQQPKTTHFPINPGVSELYAFCTEYSASELFWLNHKKNLDIYIRNQLERLKKEEKHKDLDREDSTLDPNKHPHNFAMVFGKIILSRFPSKWPTSLINLVLASAA